MGSFIGSIIFSLLSAIFIFLNFTFALFILTAKFDGILIMTGLVYLLFAGASVWLAFVCFRNLKWPSRIASALISVFFLVVIAFLFAMSSIAL